MQPGSRQNAVAEGVTSVEPVHPSEHASGPTQILAAQKLRAQGTLQPCPGWGSPSWGGAPYPVGAWSRSSTWLERAGWLGFWHPVVDVECEGGAHALYTCLLALRCVVGDQVTQLIEHILGRLVLPVVSVAGHGVEENPQHSGTIGGVSDRDFASEEVEDEGPDASFDEGVGGEFCGLGDHECFDASGFDHAGCEALCFFGSGDDVAVRVAAGPRLVVVCDRHGFKAR